MSKDTTYFCTRREKVCLEILSDLIRTNAAYINKRGEGRKNQDYLDLVQLAVSMTDEMLLRLKIQGERINDV